MAVGLDHPAVADYPRRLDAAAVTLPAYRREELVAELRGHLADALAEVGDDDAAVRRVLDRLGVPEEIVAAEAGSAGPAAPPAFVGPVSPWGPLEIIAVLGLTLGLVVLPVVGPVIGIVCAWASPRWTRREKVVASLWTFAGVAVAVLLALVAVVALGFAAPQQGRI